MFRGRLTTSKRIGVVVCLLVFVLPLSAEPLKSLKATGYVNDFAGVLSTTTISQLTNLATTIDQKAGAQIAVVIVHTLEGMEASDYANRLFQQWGVGHKDNRGVLILLAIDDHKYWTEVGYGLEPILNDAKVGDFGREMVPYLKRGDYNGGVSLITQRIANVIAQDRGVTLGTAVRHPAPAQPVSLADIPLPVLLSMMVPVVGFIIFILVVLYVLSKLGISVSVGGGGWSGGGFGDSGGGGFGGFGGGSSGGGGAGGSW